MSSEKRKGNRFEHDTVNLVESYGLEAQRALSSNGRTMGWEEHVDVVFGDFKCQLKRRASFPAYLKMEKPVNLVVFRGDREDSMALIKFEHLLAILADRT